MKIKIILEGSEEVLFEGMLSECCDYCDKHNYWIVRDDYPKFENWWVEVNEPLWKELRGRCE